MRRSAMRKKKRRKFDLFYFLIIFLALLVVGAAVLFFTDTFGIATNLKDFWSDTRAKISDPGGMRVIEGDYSIDTPDEILQDKHITGNLYLGAGIGDGSVELRNIIVDGAVLIQGGGRNTVRLHNCTLNEVKVHRPEGTVRVLATGETDIGSTVLETSAYLEEDPHPGFNAFGDVVVLADGRVDLNGDFNNVRISAENAEVHINGNHIVFMSITSTASGTRLYYNDSLRIDKFKIDAPSYLVGRGELGVGGISAAGTTEIEGSFDIARISSEAGRLVYNYGRAGQLIVNSFALNNVIHLEEETEVALLELNEAVDVTGSGLIEKLVVSAAGSTLEQVPLEVEFKADVSVLINGHEISTPEMLLALRDHGDPGQPPSETADPDPEPDPEPVTPPPPSRPIVYTVVLNISPERGGTVSGGGAFEDGKEITIKAEPREGYEFVNWTANDSEVTANKEYTFTLTRDRVLVANFKEAEPETDPDPIKKFEVAAGLTPGKKMVIVTLIDSLNPAEYRVTVAGVELPYSDSISGFRGEVDEEDALLSKVEVIKK